MSSRAGINGDVRGVPLPSVDKECIFGQDALAELMVDVRCAGVDVVKPGKTRKWIWRVGTWVRTTTLVEDIEDQTLVLNPGHKAT